MYTSHMLHTPIIIGIFSFLFLTFLKTLYFFSFDFSCDTLKSTGVQKKTSNLLYFANINCRDWLHIYISISTNTFYCDSVLIQFCFCHLAKKYFFKKICSLVLYFSIPMFTHLKIYSWLFY